MIPNETRLLQMTVFEMMPAAIVRYDVEMVVDTVHVHWKLNKVIDYLVWIALLPLEVGSWDELLIRSMSESLCHCVTSDSLQSFFSLSNTYKIGIFCAVFGAVDVVAAVAVGTISGSFLYCNTWGDFVCDCDEAIGCEWI